MAGLSARDILRDADDSRRIRAQASSAVVAETLPGLDDWAIFVARIDDDVLRLISDHATPDIPVHLFFPESLSRIDEVDAPEVIVTSAEALDTSPLLHLRPSVTTLLLNGIVAGRSRLDVSRLSGVQSLAITWSEADVRSGWSTSLTDLSIFSFTEKRLDQVPTTPRLTELELYGARRLESLDGIADLTGLRRLAIYDARRLTDLRPLATSSTLRDVTFDGCGRLGDIDVARDLARLERLALTDCQGIASLSPLRDHPTLTEFWAVGSTRILDGDLSPLLIIPRLRETGLANRRDYRPSIGQLRRALGLAEDA